MISWPSQPAFEHRRATAWISNESLSRTYHEEHIRCATTRGLGLFFVPAALLLHLDVELGGLTLVNPPFPRDVVRTKSLSLVYAGPLRSLLTLIIPRE